jgi:hypothetical protein
MKSTASNIVIVGGTFDHSGGAPSKLVNALSQLTGWPAINGGMLGRLAATRFDSYNALIWMPAIDNAEVKMLPRIKALAPHLLLASSKRVVEKTYSPFDVVKRLLDSHSNLGIVIEKPDRYLFSLVDPLGNQYCRTGELGEFAAALQARIAFLLDLTRIPALRMSTTLAATPPLPKGFMTITRSYGDAFSRCVNAVNPGRYLGNASARATDRITRCCHGFPAARAEECFLVSRRNVDKTTMSEADFVAVSTSESAVEYFGDAKPSVDTPVQVRLFNHYKNVSFLIHGHAYLDGAPMTATKIPCGYLEEFPAIAALQPDASAANFAVNLAGHGCLLLAKDLGYLAAMQHRLRPRPLYED